jgi:hypothetical protein
MGRVLLATEGPVDEVVLSALCVAWGVYAASPSRAAADACWRRG